MFAHLYHKAEFRKVESCLPFGWFRALKMSSKSSISERFGFSQYSQIFALLPFFAIGITRRNFTFSSFSFFSWYIWYLEYHYIFQLRLLWNHIHLYSQKYLSIFILLSPRFRLGFDVVFCLPFWFSSSFVGTLVLILQSFQILKSSL